VTGAVLRAALPSRNRAGVAAVTVVVAPLDDITSGVANRRGVAETRLGSAHDGDPVARPDDTRNIGRPRLAALGGDLNRVTLLNRVRLDSGSPSTAFELGRGGFVVVGCRCHHGTKVP